MSSEPMTGERPGTPDRGTRPSGLIRWPWWTLSVAAAACLLFAFGPPPAALAYQPASPTLARLVGCHLAHWSAAHLLWDVLTFCALGVLSERADRGRFVAFLATGALTIGPLACRMQPELTHYAGLSGLVLGQLAMLLTQRVREARMPRSEGGRRIQVSAFPWALLLGLLLLKQLYELHAGATTVLSLALLTGGLEGFVTVPAAHLLSVLIGTFIGALPASQGAASPPERSCAAR